MNLLQVTKSLIEMNGLLRFSSLASLKKLSGCNALNENYLTLL